MHRKIWVYALTIWGLSFLGLLVLTAEYPDDGKPWWYHFALHGLGLLGSVGMVGFFFERIFREALFEQYVVRMRELFDEDEALAKSLSDEARQKRVENSLKAHLGKEQGQAIYGAIVSRYFQARSPFRRDVSYEAVIGDLDADIVLQGKEENLTLSKEKYYKLLVEWRFERAYERYRSVACILIDDANELNYWFSRSDCLFREAASLEKADKEKIVKLLDRAADIHSELEKFFKIQVSINGTPVAAARASLLESKKSVAIQLQSPPKVGDGVPVQFVLKLSTLVAKSLGRHAFYIVEPSSNPKVTFDYSRAKNIQRVLPATFFVGAAPFEPAIESDETLRRVQITVPHSTNDESWVFPSSGVIFTWYGD